MINKSVNLFDERLRPPFVAPYKNGRVSQTRRRQRGIINNYEFVAILIFQSKPQDSVPGMSRGQIMNALCSWRGIKRTNLYELHMFSSQYWKKEKNKFGYPFSLTEKGEELALNALKKCEKVLNENGKST